MRLRAALLALSLAMSGLAMAPAPELPATDTHVADSPTEADCTDLEIVGGMDPLPYAALHACPGIRPGAPLTQPAGCTFNFVFRGTSYDEDDEAVDEGLFIGTAGHCVFDSAEPDTVWENGEGPLVKDGKGKRVGTTIYGVDEGDLDFALIRIDEHRHPDVDPSMCHFGGPVALGSDVQQQTMVHHFGQGMGFDRTVQGRSGFATHYSGGGTVMNFVGTAGPGDSGSGVIDEFGNAVGVLVRLSPGDAPGYIDAADLRFHIERAEEWTGIDFELVTAEMAD